MQIYLVGGAVRDMLLNITPEDRDYVVFGATPDEMIQLGFIPVGKDFPVFLHPVTKEEYALARREIKTGLKHTDFHFYFGKDVTKEEDVLRRDFTINALIYDEKNKQLIDLVHGREDLENKIIRHITDDHFPEDPLRVLRMCRFAAKLNFEIAPETLHLAKTMVLNGALKHLPKERIFQEFEKALQTAHFEKFLISMRDCSALKEILPELDALFETKSFQKGLQILKKASDEPIKIKYALLLSFLKKDSVYSVQKRLNTPKKYADFARLYHQNKPLLTNGVLTAKKLLLFLEKVTRFSKPEQLNDFLSTLSFEFQTLLLKEKFEKIKKLCLENFQIQNHIHATDMPYFEKIRKDAELKKKLQQFRQEKIKLT